MPGDSEILQQILLGVQQSRGEVNRLENAIVEMARSVNDLAKSAVRFEENIEHLENRMEDEIKRLRQSMTEQSQSVKELADSVRTMQQLQQKLDTEIRLLKKAKEDDDQNKKWLWRTIVDKLIWPTIAAAATAVAVFTNKS